MHTPESALAVLFADLGAQYRTIEDEIDASVTRVITESAFVGGPHVAEFERAFARYCGTKHCVGVANGTDAIFIALKTLGIGSGDEVITAANTFIATSEAITLTGARPVFVDIDPHTYTIDVDRIEDRITDRTRAIVPVHLYGQPADMDPIRRLAQAYGLFVVGDAAQAHGAQYHGLPVSTLAHITSYSFYPGKNLGAYGDAGALVTDNDDWAMRARMIANHGRTSRYDHDVEGVNSRLDGMQAAILSAKLPHIHDWTAQRLQAWVKTPRP